MFYCMFRGEIKLKRYKNECYVRIYYLNDFVHSFNEGLPTKCSDLSVKYNSSSIEKDVGTAIELSTKRLFILNKY